MRFRKYKPQYDKRPVTWLLTASVEEKVALGKSCTMMSGKLISIWKRC